MVLNFFEDQEIKGEITFSNKRGRENDKELNNLNIKQELIELINAGLSLSAASKYLAKKKSVKKA